MVESRSTTEKKERGEGFLGLPSFSLVLVVVVVFSLVFNAFLYIQLSSVSQELASVNERLVLVNGNISLLGESSLVLASGVSNLSEGFSALGTRVRAIEDHSIVVDQHLMDVRIDLTGLNTSFSSAMSDLGVQVSSLENQTQLAAGPDLDSIVKSVFKVESGDSQGSAVVVDSRGYLLTSYHVIQNRRTIKLWSSTGKEYAASLVAYSTDKDLALIKPKSTLGVTFTPLEFEKQRNIKVGDQVYAIGYPAEQDVTITKGVVSAVDREIDGIDHVQTDVPINPGSSGGPVVNNAGRIVGLSTSKFVGWAYEGIGFAVQSNLLEGFVESQLSRIED